MAGSYRHCCANMDDAPGDTDPLGSFRFDLIENMGDAWEACEQMHFMVQFLAGGNAVAIERAEAAYYANLHGDA